MQAFMCSMHACMQVCGSDDNGEQLLLCDNEAACSRGFHTYCLKPKLKKVRCACGACRACMTHMARHGPTGLS